MELLRSYRFPRTLRLSDTASVRHAFKQRSFFEAGVRLFVAKNNCGHNRYVCTFRRNFATAVQRNRIKRICKEMFRHLHGELKQGYDLIFLFTEDKRKISVRKNPVVPLLVRAGLFSEN